MTRTQPEPEVDLFGNPATSASTAKPAKKRGATNDMDLIESVLKIARMEGYAVVGPNERVYHVDSKRGGVEQISAVPAYEDQAVHQLLDQGILEVGGHHTYGYRNSRTGIGRSILVPTRSRRKSALWGALQRPSTWRTADAQGKEAQ